MASQYDPFDFGDALETGIGGPLHRLPTVGDLVEGQFTLAPSEPVAPTGKVSAPTSTSDREDLIERLLHQAEIGEAVGRALCRGGK